LDLPGHPQLHGCVSSRRGFDPVDVGTYNQEEKVEGRHRGDGDQKAKKEEERGGRERGKKG